MVSQYGFQNSKSNNSLLHKWIGGDILMFSVYVDDIITLHLGELNPFLGIEVTKISNGMHLSQAK